MLITGAELYLGKDQYLVKVAHSLAIMATSGIMVLANPPICLHSILMKIENTPNSSVII